MPSMTNDLSYNQLYSDQINSLTLSEALESHYRLNPQFTPWQKYSQGILQLTMKAHDICHVISGLDTSLLGEFRVELWTFMATKSGDNNNYTKIISNPKVLAEPLEIAKKLGYLKVLKFMVFNFGEIFAVRKMTKKMKKKWICFEEEKYMQVTLGKIRQEFEIELID